MNLVLPPFAKWLNITYGTRFNLLCWGKLGYVALLPSTYGGAMSETRTENRLHGRDGDEPTTKIRIRKLGKQETAHTVLSTSYGN